MINQDFRRYYKSYKSILDEKQRIIDEENEKLLKIKEEELRIKKEEEDKLKQEEELEKEKEAEKKKIDLKKVKTSEKRNEKDIKSDRNENSKDESKQDKSLIINKQKVYTTLVKEEIDDKKDNYSSECLLPIIQKKFEQCQNFVEEYILREEQFWSINRNKFYKIIPLLVEPPKIEENEDVPHS